jgi:hypothetical protein
MAKHGMELSNSNLSKKRHNHSLQGIHQVLQEAESEVRQIGRESVNRLMRTTEDFNHHLTECVGACTGHLDACTKSSNELSHLFQHISDEMMDSYARTFSDAAAIAHEALGCRTLKDITALQSKATQQMIDHYFKETNKVSGMVFSSCNGVFKPFNEQAARTSKQLRKVIAA